MHRFGYVLSLTLLLAGCRTGESALEEYNTRALTLPDGTVIRVEPMIQQMDMERGMMFRDSLPEGRGMLFLHAKPGLYPYWMFQVKVPLDIVWLDARKQIVEISENTPPCTTKASECPKYGGTKEAQTVLELPAGYGRKHGVRVGNTINF